MDINEICLHYEDDYDSFKGAIGTPLFQTSLFTRKRVNSGYTYSRVANPTVEIVEKKLAKMEGADECCLFSSGMAAITAVFSCALKPGDHVIALKSIYYPASEFLRNNMRDYGVEVDFLSDFTLTEIEKVLKPNTRMLYFESPSSNIFKIVDIKAITVFAKQHGLLTGIDNTYSTPAYQNPCLLGVDYVIHSVTKYLGGHSDLIAGAVICDNKNIVAIRQHRANYGACPDPFLAWLIARSLRTFNLRIKQHFETGLQVARFLEQHPKVKAVYYPFLESFPGYDIARQQMSGCTGLMSFILDCDKETAWKFVKDVKLFEEGPSWGGYESLMNTPGLWEDEVAREKEDVPFGLIRISVGLESASSIIEALSEVLDRI